MTHATSDILDPHPCCKAQGCWPERCTDCNKDLQRWKRFNDWFRRLKERFSPTKHQRIRLLSFGMPHEKRTTPERYAEDAAEYRSELYERFRHLRRRKWWKDTVDGGIAFYEVTTRTADHQKRLCEPLQVDGCEHDAETLDERIHIHPHLHVILLSRFIDLDQVEEELNACGLGSSNVRAINSSAGLKKYLSKYLKKDNQIEGRNRVTFGIARKSLSK